MNPPGLKKLHHIGKVVQDMESEFKKYKELGLEVEEKIFVDTEQKVKVGKVKIGNFMIELLQPLNEESPICRFHKEKKTFHHLCFEVDDIDGYLDYIIKNGIGFRLTKTTKSVFEGKKVCFVSTNDREVIELIERGES